ncbi:uncharacterized protein TRIADDRAFT_60375 [Trichoplax adhaerens]|uniref:Chromatin assembly factor 1 subunit p150 C-terminal domain-containing protein n=1 Tax=Trichoplax adhaerens TaxID=10228 RepID=B3S819_TRIAD|nr:hypothetical protein TRIADDRAFT_60375 [Trichoplax adhaerens]EDV21029.1 hypothetical protein TRIADDRAFT_60375 [Trichoplax adhaerens]|eukprot:XP_002116359.1 hypothetical protein TRIADDRAFT_60375 [Trichoplax adhaerens]
MLIDLWYRFSFITYAKSIGSNRSNANTNKNKGESSPGSHKKMKQVVVVLVGNWKAYCLTANFKLPIIFPAPLTSFLSSAKSQSKEDQSTSNGNMTDLSAHDEGSITYASSMDKCDQTESKDDLKMVPTSPNRKQETPSKKCASRICIGLFSSPEVAVGVESISDCNSLNKLLKEECAYSTSTTSKESSEDEDSDTTLNQCHSVDSPKKRHVESDDNSHSRKKKIKKDPESDEKQKQLKELERKKAKEEKQRLKKEKRLQREEEKKRMIEEERQKRREEKRRLAEERLLEQEEEKKRKSEEKRRQQENRKEALRQEKEQKLKERQVMLEIKREQLAKEKEEKRLESDRKKKERQEAKDKLMEEKRKQKEQDKLARQQEKRKKEEEKQKVENEELRKKQKERDTFAKFFIKAPKPESTKIAPAQGLKHFPAFELKPGMTLAPTVSSAILDPTKFEEELQKQDFDRELSIQQLRNSKGIVSKSLRSNNKDANSDDYHMVAKHATNGQVFLVRNSKSSNTCQEAVMEITAAEEVQFRHQEMVAIKFLQFHDNYRPAYFGTWRKSSKTISPRNPWRKDEKLVNYEYDSDGDWEEDDPGESLSQSENEAESDEDEDDDDGFFVPHGYLSADEGVCSDENDGGNEGKSLQPVTKAKTWEADIQRKCKQLQPLVIGCSWSSTGKSHYLLENCACKPLLDFPINPDFQDTKSIKTSEKHTSDQSNTKNGNSPATRRGRGGKEGRVPEEALPDLIKLIHGSTNSLQRLIEEFRDFWYKKQSENEIKADLQPENSLKVASSAANSDLDSPKRKSDEISGSTDITSNSNQVSPSHTSEIESYAISKRQIEVKILSMAQKERRDSDVKMHWYVDDTVLESFGLLEWSRTRDRTNDGDNTPRVYIKKKKL